jgi:hypothetical protein
VLTRKLAPLARRRVTALQHEILSYLGAAGGMRSNKQILETLRWDYDISPGNLNACLSRLCRLGDIRRPAQGWYELVDPERYDRLRVPTEAELRTQTTQLLIDATLNQLFAMDTDLTELALEERGWQKGRRS